MRYLALVMGMAVFLPACNDAVGPAGDCEDEMTAVRGVYGPPDSTRREESDGDFFETWTYEPQGGEEGRIVVFRWGITLESCAVEPPISLAVEPSP